MKKFLYAAAICVLGVMLICVYAKENKAAGQTNEDRIKYIESFGWETEHNPAEEVKLTLPDKADSVYKEYNDILSEAGLNIMPYMGREVVRYTYIIKNHKNADGRQVRANILVCDGKIIAADVMTSYIGGFMHAINRSEYAER